MRIDIKKFFLAGIMIVTIAALPGCANSQSVMQPEPAVEQESDGNIASSYETESSELEEHNNSEEEKTVEVGIGSLRSEAEAYFGTTYGNYLKKGGAEADFLHGGRYIAECPDLDAEVVFEGMWHEDTTDFTIEDSSEFLRLEGKVAAFFTGNVEELNADEFLKQLGENYTVSSEYRESAGTAYYVSAKDYLHIELEPKGATGADAIVEIACTENEKITPESYCWIMENKPESISFSEIPTEFVFSSGAGAWGTGIDISEDGSFVGQFHDSDMGSSGDGYPNGTVYVCNFSGKFSNPEPTDKQYIYSMKLLEINIDDKKEVDTEEIVDGVRYVYSEPYGFENADEFIIYLPGASLSEMTEECRWWIFLSDSIFKEVPDGYFVIYNVGGEEAFTATSDDSIWYRRCTFTNGKAYATFAPSNYMGSYLSFFTEENVPASMALSVPWDGKSKDPMECENSMGDDRTKVNVTIESDEENDPLMLKYVITVECISDPQFDFSPWGSSEPGKFRAVFIEGKEE